MIDAQALGRHLTIPGGRSGGCCVFDVLRGGIGAS